MVFSNLRPHTDLQGALSVFEDSAAYDDLTWQKVTNKGKLVVGVKRGHREQLSVSEKETKAVCCIRYELMSKREWRADGGQKEVILCSSATWLLPYQRLFRKVPGIESGS